MPTYQVARLGQRRVRGPEEENRRGAKRADQQWVTNQSRYLTNCQDAESCTEATPGCIAQ